MKAMENFTFYSPKIIFGRETFTQVAKEVKALGDSVLVVTGKTAMRKAGITERLEQILSQEGISYELMETVDPEPTLEHIEDILLVLERIQVDSVLALGGGSVIDVAKVVGGVYGHLKEQNIRLRDFLGHDIAIPGLPVIAIPTTAGTGSEVTKNSVIINPQTKTKSSIFRHPLMIPKVAIIDPVLMVSMPPNITAASGMDALTQAIEAYVTRKENALCVTLAIQAIEVIGRNLLQAFENGSNIAVREKMAYGSLISALAFSNSSLGAVHGLAHPHGVHLHAPHGVICALLLPHVMEFNKDTKGMRFAKIGTVFHDPREMLNVVRKTPTELIEHGIAYIRNLLNKLHLPVRLREIGMGEEDIPLIVKNTKGSSLNNNPRKAGPSELTQILQKAL